MSRCRPPASRNTVSAGPLGQRAVQPGPGRAGRPQRGVVGGQPLAVAEHAAGDAERAHGDDRDERSRTGGICQALAISQAETPASASALPSARTPNGTASAGAAAGGAAGRGPRAAGHGRDMGRALRRVTIAVADGAGRRPGARPPGRWRLARDAARSTGSEHRLRARRRGGRSVRRAAGPGREPERPGQAQPLPLTQRQPGAVAADHGVQTVGQRREDVVETGWAAGAVEIGERAEQFEVLAHRAGDQPGRCGSQATWLPPLPRVEVGDIDVADQHAARRSARRGRGWRATRWTCPRRSGPVRTVSEPGGDVAPTTGAAHRRRAAATLTPRGGSPCPSACARPSRAGSRRRRAARAAFARRSSRPGRRETPRRRGATARRPRVPAAARSARRPASTSPYTSRNPTLTATSATPRVASSSSTSDDRNAIRSVAIAERRWASASSVMRSLGPSARPSARRVGMPVIRSSSRDCRVVMAVSAAAERSAVTRPMSTMNSGISGSAISDDDRGLQVVAARSHHRGGGEDRGVDQRGQIAGEVRAQSVQARVVRTPRRRRDARRGRAAVAR